VAVSVHLGYYFLFESALVPYINALLSFNKYYGKKILLTAGQTDG
jgi:hypothetical protein